MMCYELVYTRPGSRLTILSETPTTDQEPGGEFELTETRIVVLTDEGTEPIDFNDPRM